MTGRTYGRASLGQASAGRGIGTTAAVILVVRVGDATGSKAAAAALASAGSEPDRAGLLIDLGGGRLPRPSLIASTAARELEERLVVHLPEAGVASRGQVCQLALPPDRAGSSASRRRCRSCAARSLRSTFRRASSGPPSRSRAYRRRAFSCAPISAPTAPSPRSPPAT